MFHPENLQFISKTSGVSCPEYSWNRAALVIVSAALFMCVSAGTVYSEGTQSVIEKLYSRSYNTTVIRKFYSYNSINIKKPDKKTIKLSKASLNALANLRQYNSLIEYYSKLYSINPNVIRAVICIESGGNPVAVSRKGACGLMQLMPVTAKEMNVRDIWNPAENIRGGVRYLKHLLDRFDTIDRALWAYNAGPTSLIKSRNIRKADNYVKDVLSLKLVLDTNNNNNFI